MDVCNSFGALYFCKHNNRKMLFSTNTANFSGKNCCREVGVHLFGVQVAILVGWAAGELYGVATYTPTELCGGKTCNSYNALRHEALSRKCVTERKGDGDTPSSGKLRI